MTARPRPHGHPGNDAARASLELTRAVEVLVLEGGPGRRATCPLTNGAEVVGIGLPVLDGYAVARRLREALGGRPADRPDRPRRPGGPPPGVGGAGFDHYLVKPAPTDLLPRLLQAAPVRSRMRC